MTMNVTISRLGGDEAPGAAKRVWRVYKHVFGDISDAGQWRDELFLPHAERDDYRLVLAEDGGDLIGFAWGYRGRRGQFWSDLVAEHLPEVADAWVGDHFEFVELGVSRDACGAGVGSRLHDALLEGVEGRCLLSTDADDSDPAARLYRRAGWQSLGLLNPETQVMGLIR